MTELLNIYSCILGNIEMVFIRNGDLGFGDFLFCGLKLRHIVCVMSNCKHGSTNLRLSVGPRLASRWMLDQHKTRNLESKLT